ncbi:MAG: efflux transporter protein [Hyphomicrobiales bacterium]|nr:efflux transporter protein [Hyphomicrobiales bacterium]
MNIRILAAAACSLLVTCAAQAQTSFAGKQVTIGIGSSTGGGLDTYGRLVARHLGKHVPGNPTVVPSNMPGAGGGIVAAYLANKAPTDGTFIGLVFPGIIVDPLLSESLRKNYDPSTFNYMGNAHSETLVCLVRRDAEVKTPADLLTTPSIIGATAAGSTTFDFPTALNSVLGAKMKIVTGYKGSREVTLAVERGEVQGICGVGWSTIKVQYPDVLKSELFARVFAQEDMKGHPQLTAAGVPLMIDLARSESDRKVMEVFYAQNAFARPLILPQAVPAPVVETLRRALDATMKDPELLAEAEKMNIDVIPSTGEQVQDLVARMYRTDAETVERVKKTLGR